MKSALGIAMLLGLPLAAFVAASPFYPMDHGLWLRVNSLLVIGTLGGAAMAGYRLGGATWSRTVPVLAGYTASIGVLFLGSYFVSTWYFAGAMKWMPFFHRDFVYHQYASVEAFLFRNQDYANLFQLQAFSFLICAAAYLAAGSLAWAVSTRFRLRRARD